MDPYEYLQISRKPDGSLARLAAYALTPATPDHTGPASAPVLSKDVPLDAARNTSIRVFLPTAASGSEEAPKRLPVVIYFHGGGFILFSPAHSLMHDACARLAAALPALVLSVDYRLAPEHRLPAAHDDAADALLWLRDHIGSDPWLRGGADPARVFLMGSSAGGSIAFHAALRARELDVSPLELAGVVLDQPFFGGVERTESERRMADDRILPLPANDLMWELALPEGADRDHELCNPMAMAGRRQLGLLPRCLVRAHTGDPLSDRQREFAGMLERAGVGVVARVREGGHHGMELFMPDKEEVLLADVKSFVYDGASAAPPGLGGVSIDG